MTTTEIIETLYANPYGRNFSLKEVEGLIEIKSGDFCANGRFNEITSCGFTALFSEEKIAEVIDGILSYEQWMKSYALGYTIDLKYLANPIDLILAGTANIAGNFKTLDEWPELFYVSSSLCQKLIGIEQKENKPGFALHFLMIGPVATFTCVWQRW
jgi:hypothetical protein